MESNGRKKGNLYDKFQEISGVFTRTYLSMLCDNNVDCAVIRPSFSDNVLFYYF